MPLSTRDPTAYDDHFNYVVLFNEAVGSETDGREPTVVHVEPMPTNFAVVERRRMYTWRKACLYYFKNQPEADAEGLQIVIPDIHRWQNVVITLTPAEAGTKIITLTHHSATIAASAIAGTAARLAEAKNNSETG